MKTKKPIIRVCKKDMEILGKLVHVGLQYHDGLTGEYYRVLRAELQQARVLPTGKMPPNIVKLDSVVSLMDLDTGDAMTLTLVMPEHADAGDCVSILSPLGMAIFGYRTGDTIAWGPIRSPIRLRIDQVDGR